MKRVFLKQLHERAKHLLRGRLAKVEYPRWYYEKWRDQKGHHRVTRELRIRVTMPEGKRFVDEETAALCRELADAHDLWYVGADMAGSSGYQPGTTKLAFIKKEINTAYQTHHTGRAGAGTLHFDGVWEKRPTTAQLAKAQERCGYHPMGYGGPGSVQVDRRPDGLYRARWVCSGSCE